MRNMFKVVSIIVLMLGISFGAYSNGLNLNGMGTKAISMGGAFIAVADDYSAVFWNPAGLTQMDKANLSVFSSVIIPTGTYQYAPAGIDMETESKMFPAPALTYYKPLSDKLVFGLTVYATSGAGAYWDGADLKPFNTGFPLNTKAYKWESQVGGITFSPVVAYKVSDKLSLGVTLNVTYGMLDMYRQGNGFQFTEEATGIGFGATFGALFKPSDKLSFGFTFKTPQKLELKGDIAFEGLSAAVPIPGLNDSVESTREITWPMWIGAGVAFKPTDKLTIAFDVQYTQWSELGEIPATTEDPMWSATLPFVGKLIDNATYELMWEDATQIRVGFDYKLSDTFSLRGGYYSDPAPSPDTTLNILLPSISYNVFTVGFGYHTEKLILDAGFEYLSGADREADMSLGKAMPGTHGMSMLVPTISLTFIF